MQKLSLEDAIYLAAFIDGEGCIGIVKRQHKSQEYIYDGYSCYLEIASTNLEILEWMRGLLGGSVYKKKVQKSNWKQGYNWRLGGKEAALLLRQCLPYMRIKRQQAELLLQFPFGKKTAPFVQQKDDLFLKAQVLNRRGIHQQ